MTNNIERILGKGNLTDEDYRQIEKHVRLQVTKKYEYPPEIIKVRGTTIATLGNFSASTGKPKSKKTFNVSAIVASALCDHEVLQYRTTLPPGKKRVMYFDTEQSEFHCQNVQHRVLRLAGLPLNAEQENLEFHVLRGLDNAVRRGYINWKIREAEGVGLVIIDGARDLISDINSPNESSDIINDFMRWSSVYGVHIHTVLHLNKSDDNTRGHLGTELNNKAETILQVTKCKDNPNVSEVRAMHIRDKDFLPFAFSVNDDGLPQLDESYKSEQRDSSKYGKLCYLDETIHHQALENAFGEGALLTVEHIKTALIKAYENLGYKRGQSAMNDQYKFLVSCNAIVKEETGYRYNRESKIQPSDKR